MKVLWIIEGEGNFNYVVKLLRSLNRLTPLKLKIAGVISVDSEINPAIPFIPEHQFETVLKENRATLEKIISGLKNKLKFEFETEIVVDRLPRGVENIRKKFKPSLTIVEPEPFAGFPFSIGSPIASMIRSFREDFLVIKGNAHFPPKKIALPVDASPFSIRTIKRGLSISEKFKSSLEIFTVLETRNIRFPQGMVEEMLKISEEELRRKISKKYGEIKGMVNISALEGKNAEDGIIEFIHNKKCDLVIMGKHGHTFVEELLGTVTEKVLRYSPVPVWVVSNPERKLL